MKVKEQNKSDSKSIRDEKTDSVETRNTLYSLADNEATVGLINALRRSYVLISVLAAGLIIVSLISAIGYFRRPKVIVSVLTPDGQRIAKIDDVNFGATDSIQMGEDNLSNKDKSYLINQFLSSFYGVDLASRGSDVKKFLSILIPSSARKLYKDMTDSGYLQRERDEAYSSSWETESVEVDKNEKNVVRVIGKQKLQRIVGEKPINEIIQYKITFNLRTNGKREDTPLRSGYWVERFNAEEISRTKEN